MGDVSWVLLAADPVLTLQLKALLVVTGTVTGGLADALRITPTRRRVDTCASVQVPAPGPVAVQVPGPPPLPWSVITSSTGFRRHPAAAARPRRRVVGVLVGLVPGCAIQIVFAGLVLSSGMPVATFVASTVSQDGDALIPLLALEHRSALLATVITSVPALAIGATLHFLL